MCSPCPACLPACLSRLGLPLDIQLLLDKSLDAPPTAVSVGIKTTLGLGIMEIMDITYVVPPLTVNIASPVTAGRHTHTHHTTGCV